MLDILERAFQNLRDNAPLPEDVRQTTETVLSALLASINRESNTGVPYLPEDLEFTW